MWYVPNADTTYKKFWLEYNYAINCENDYLGPTVLNLNFHSKTRKPWSWWAHKCLNEYELYYSVFISYILPSYMV